MNHITTIGEVAEGRGVRFEGDSRVISFDVFDTVLTRVVGSPHAIFLLLGRQLARAQAICCTPEVFARQRLSADRRAFRNAGGRDSHVTLHEIYTELTLGGTVPAGKRKEAIRAEVALEERMLRPVPGAKAALVEARREGRVVFISDTYLAADFIERQLRAHGLFEEGDGCYVSSHYGASKGSGRLFRRVLEEEELDPHRLTHHGNDRVIDILPARRVGVAARYRPEGNVNRYERLLEQYRWSTGGLSSALAGASRLARLAVPSATDREESIRNVAAGVAAPLLFAYVSWVLRRAAEGGVDRLYFLSRDGQQLLRLARVLAPRLGIGCELRYLFGSRRVWNLAAARDLSDEALDWVLTHPRHATVRSLLGRLNVTPEEIAPHLEAAGIPASSWGGRLGSGHLDTVLQVIRGGEVSRLVTGRMEKAHALAKTYLEQEDFFGRGTVGLVDLGGVGSQLHALARFREETRCSVPLGFLAYREGNEGIGRSSSQPSSACSGPETFLFDHVRGTGVARFGGCVPFLEAFCAADHGSVAAYRQQGARVEPVLEQHVNEGLLRWGLPLVRGTIDQFIDHMLMDDDFVDLDGDLREAVSENLRLFVTDPTREEALAWAEFPFDGTGQERRLARRWSIHDLARLPIEGSLPAEWFTWRDGSRVISGPAVRTALYARDAARRLGRVCTRWSRRMFGGVFGLLRSPGSRVLR